jgi:perosamine synthetase
MITVQKRIPVAETILSGNEQKYVQECLDTGWISGSGKFVTAFEEQFAAFCGAKYGIAVFNGTVALHVALLGLGIGPGDEVIVPDFTYVASPNSVKYCNAVPVFADIDPLTWTLDAEDVARKITPRTKAIMPVHIYGHPTDMQPLLSLAREHDLKIVEDAAEAHGAEYRGKRIGSIGDVATFSFYGNKIISTGEGGMIVTNNEQVARLIRQLKGQGQDLQRRYWFPMIGYNYRMTNIQAAIGLAQFERIDWFIERRIEVAHWYTEYLKDTDLLLPTQAEWAKNVFWLYSICLPYGVDRQDVMQQLDEAGIETRPFFYPMHSLPPYYDVKGDQTFPVSTSIAARGINLPSSANLTKGDIAYITDKLKACVEPRVRHAGRK